MEKKKVEWKDLILNLKGISSHATPKEDLKNKLIQSNPKRWFKEKHLPFHPFKQSSSQQMDPWVQYVDQQLWWPWNWNLEFWLNNEKNNMRPGLKKKKKKFHQILEWNHHFRTNIVLSSENKTELKHSKNKLFKLKTNDNNFTMQHRSSYGTYECHISQTICHDLTQH